MVNVEKLSENRVKLTVTVSAEDFDKALDVAFDKVSKHVNEPGFRPGKFPKSMFIKKYGYEALYQDACDAAINSSYYPAMAEAKVYPCGDPKIDLCEDTKIEKGSELKYTIEVDVWPEVHLGEYKGLAVKKAAVKVAKKDVDEYIEGVLKSKAENVVKDGAAEMGDTVVFDYCGSIDGVEFAGGKQDNANLELGSHQFIPGFEEGLVGATSEQELDVNVTFPEDYQAKELAGKAAVFKCKVHEIKTKVTPVLDDEFVKELEIENVNTVEEYQAYAKETLKKQKTEEADRNFENECVEAVLNGSFADFPQSLIESAVGREVAGLEQQAKQYNIPADVLVQYYGMASMDDFKKKTEEKVRKQFLSELVFDKIVELEKIEATDKEIEAEYLEIAQGDASKVADLKKRYQQGQVAYQVKVNKVVELIKKNVAKAAAKEDK